MVLTIILPATLSLLIWGHTIVFIMGTNNKYKSNKSNKTVHDGTKEAKYIEMLTKDFPNIFRNGCTLMMMVQYI